MILFDTVSNFTISNMPPKSKRQRNSSAAKSIRDENAGKYQYLRREEHMDLEDIYKDGPRESDIDLVSKLDLHTIGDLFELLKNELRFSEFIYSCLHVHAIHGTFLAIY